jgi:hypothetical protein
MPRSERCRIRGNCADATPGHTRGQAVPPGCRWSNDPASGSPSQWNSLRHPRAALSLALCARIDEGAADDFGPLRLPMDRSRPATGWPGPRQSSFPSPRAASPSTTGSLRLLGASLTAFGAIGRRAGLSGSLREGPESGRKPSFHSEHETGFTALSGPTPNDPSAPAPRRSPASPASAKNL